MFESAWFAVILVFAIPVVAYLVRMARLWIKTIRIAYRGPGIRIRLERRETRLEDLSPEMREFVGMVVGQFREKGFEVATNTTEEQAYLPGMQSTQMILVNRLAAEVAVVVAVLTRVNVKGATSERRDLGLSVASRFDDDSTISTYSRSETKITRRQEGDDPINVSWVRDARALCEFHRRRVKGRGKEGQARIFAEKGKELEYTQQRLTEKYERLIRAGLNYADETTGRYRLTWKGAIITGLRVSPPFNRWLAKSEKRAALREWKRLGMEGWEPARSATTGVEEMSLATATAPAQTGMNYEPSLGPGEMRMEEEGGHVTVQIARPNRTPFVLRKLASIALLTFSLLAGAFYLCVILVIQQQNPDAIGGRSTVYAMTVMVAGVTVMLAWRVGLFLRQFRLSRRETTVSASKEGITITNMAAPKKPLFVARHDIVGLTAIPAGSGAIVQLRTFDGKRRVLLVGRNGEDVMRAKSAIISVLGMASEADARLEAAAAAHAQRS